VNRTVLNRSRRDPHLGFPGSSEMASTAVLCPGGRRRRRSGYFQRWGDGRRDASGRGEPDGEVCSVEVVQISGYRPLEYLWATVSFGYGRNRGHKRVLGRENLQGDAHGVLESFSTKMSQQNLLVSLDSSERAAGACGLR
jgi:hypothetical protein